MDQAEDHLIFSANTDAGVMLDEDQAKRLLTLPAIVKSAMLNFPETPEIEAFAKKRCVEIQRTISERNARFYEAEADKLDGWADDLKVGLEREIKEFDRQIKEARRSAVAALTLDEKLAGQKQIKSIEGQRNERRRSLFEAQDQIDQRRESLISQIESKLVQNVADLQLFQIRWHLV
jgi:adenine-specific DNA-methyltransferase